MKSTLLLILIVAALFADGRSDGRRGNAAFAEGDYPTAAEAFQKGLDEAAEEGDPSLLFGLTNNLGASRYRMDDHQAALEAFEAAALAATEPAATATAEYNAGNAAFKAQDLERAVAHYRRALLANPNDPDAKFNYEFVKRQLQDQQQQQPQPDQQNDDQEGDGQQEPQQQDGEQEQQDDQGQQEQEEEQEEQDQQQQDGGDQEEQEQEQEQNQQAQSPQNEQDLSREQAERILQALESEEAELLREIQRMDTPARRVEKDW